MSHIPIKAAKLLVRKYHLTHCIIFAHDQTHDHITTYGKSLTHSSQAANFGNQLKTILNWPLSLHAQPAKLLQLQSRIKELETQIATMSTPIVTWKPQSKNRSQKKSTGTKKERSL
jgi:hypothetical protein